MLSRPAGLPVHVPMNAHLSADDLSGMVDGRLPATRRAVVEAHLAVCADCRAELVSASAIVESAPPVRVRRPNWIGRGMVAAAAVLVVLTIPRVVKRVPRATTGERSGPNAGAPATALTLVNPTPRLSIDRDSLRFIWRGAPGASYRVFVADSAGVQVFTTATTDTTVVPPRSLELVSGARYLWFVEALRADGSSVRTPASNFRIGAR